MGPFSIQCFRCSEGDGGVVGGEGEVEAAGLVVEGLAHGVCGVMGAPLSIT